MVALYTFAAVVILIKIARAIWRIVIRPMVTFALLSGVTFALVAINNGNQTITALSGIGALLIVNRVVSNRNKETSR